MPANHFDALYPARLDWALLLTPGLRPVGKVLAQIKQALPFNLRFEAAKDSVLVRSAYERVVELPLRPVTLYEVMSTIVDVLPSWQATALPGYVILYSQRADIPSARVVWRKDGKDVVIQEQQPELAGAAEIAADLPDEK